MLTCPSCGTDNTEGSKFCNECGTKLEATPVREERKVITALFCDLVGSTALGERLDAEDISRLLRDYQTICRKRIESHGGVVEKFIGDAVVGVFGVPLSHEDDPERAVRAALRITEDIGASDLGIEVRIGVNTGEALVRLDVDPRSGEGFATGDTMNTAARLETAAPVMGVAVGAVTHRASEGAIAYEALAPIAAKGKAEPVEAWRALHPIARVGTEERDRTPFVGRDLELSVLTQLFDRSRSRPATEFVSVIAEPGLGKSRLVRELARHVDRLPNLVIWREGRCLPYGDGISFWALGEIVKAQTGILETDDQDTLSSKLDQAITEPAPQTKDWIKDRLAPLVGLETSTEPPKQEEAFTAWRRFLEQIAAIGPTVLVIEDLHWADDAFVAFLEHLTERTAGLPLLVVVTARPEVEERHPSWPPGRRSTVLSLSPLTDGDVETLITQSLPEADPELIRIVLERAGGSPLYAEQLAAMLRERALPIAGGALDETLIPASVQALIAARIDALPSEPKRVLMEASVVGKTFWSGAVASLGEHEDLGSSLGELVRREFCRPVHPSTMEGDAEFGFWHALVRDVAYAELTRAERGRMHAATARWIADRTDGAMGEDAEIIVEHLQQALVFGEQLGGTEEISRLRDELATSLVSAGEHALRVDTNRAESHFERALDLISPGEPLRIRALDGRGQALLAAGATRQAADVYGEAVADCRDRGDTAAIADLAIPASRALRNVGRAADAEALLDGARDWFHEQRDPRLVEALSEMARIALAGQLHIQEAAQLAEMALSAADEFGLPPPHGALSVRAGELFMAGDSSAVTMQREAAEAAIAAGDLLAAKTHFVNVSVGTSNMEGPLKGLPLLDDAIRFAEERGLTSADIGANRIEVLAELGRWDEVVDESPALLTWASVQGDGFTTIVIRTALQSVWLERGEDPGEVEDLLGLATDVGIERVHCAAVVARAALARGKREEAVSILDREVTAATTEELGYHVRELVRACFSAGSTDLARLVLDKSVQPGGVVFATNLTAARASLKEMDGDIRGACDGYRYASTAYERLGMLPACSDMLFGLGRCFLALDERDGCTQALREARGFSERLKAAPRIAEIDELLATLSTAHDGSA